MREKLNRMKNDKAFIKKTIAITLPIAIQGLLNTSINFIDTIMIGSLGETTIAGVGLANKIFFVFSLLVFGIVSGSGILTAQYWGKREIFNIKRVLGISLILSLVAAFIFALPSIFLPTHVMSIFTNSRESIRIGTVYLAIVAISYPFTAITNAYVSLLRGVNQVKIPVIISTVSIFVNLILNYALIFGNFGFPELGVAGAAIATLIARLVECLTLLTIIYKNKGPAAAKLSEMLELNRDFIKKYFHTVAPVIANEFMWGLGVTVYSIAYGRMGDNAVASITITQTIEQIITVIFMSISNAAAVILGNEMGAGKLEDAEVHSVYLIILQFLLTIIMGLLFFLMKDSLIGMFRIIPEVAILTNRCIMVSILFMPFKMLNALNIVGILRSGGDTKACLVLDTSGVWLIGIPMAFIGGLFLHLPIYFVYAMVLTEEIYKFILGTIRYKQKKWLKNLVESNG